MEKELENSRQQYEALAADNSVQLELESVKQTNQSLIEKIEAMEDSNSKLQKEVNTTKIPFLFLFFNLLELLIDTLIYF